MRKFSALTITSVLAMMLGTAHAQVKVVIDNQTIPTEDIQSITILKNTNEINIATTRAYTVAPVVVGEDVAIHNFWAVPTQISEGESTSINWTTSNATQCTPSGGAGGWSAVNVGGIGLDSGNVDITITTAGVYTFTLTCQDAQAGSVFAETDVTVIAANQVVIDSFTATPAAINEGGSTTLDWATTNATSCTASNNAGVASWNGSVPTSGSIAVTVDNAGNYTFTLSCQDDSGGTDVDNEPLVVSPVVANCDPSPLSAGVIVDWQTFWQTAFPGPSYRIIYNADVPRFGYKAIEFNTANFVDDGKITLLENTSTSGVRLGAYSECPGDFDVAPECQFVWGLGGGLRWSTNGRDDACELQPNTTYYFNVTFTDGFDETNSTCNGSPCRIHAQHLNR